MDNFDDLLAGMSPPAATVAPPPAPAAARRQITQPCFIDGMSLEEYHRPDITPTPALSSSGAKILLSQTPAHFRHEVLLKQREPKKAFEIGEAAHLMVLEPDLFEERIERIDAGDYKTAAAKAARDDARAVGRIPLLPKEVDMVERMRRAIVADPVASILHEPAVTERSYFWQDPETGVWLKARVDKLIDERPADGTLDLMDYKTSTDVSPSAFRWAAFGGRKRTEDEAPDVGYGYHISLAHYAAGIAAVTGDRVDHCILIAQEKTAPYLAVPYTIDPDTVAVGADHMRRAIRLFAECLSSDRWPGYPPKTIGLSDFVISNHRFIDAEGPAFANPNHAQGHAAQAPQAAE